MSIPPFRQPTELQAEARRQQAREIEADAARQAQARPDGGGTTSPGPIRRALQRLRAAVAGRG